MQIAMYIDSDTQARHLVELFAARDSDCQRFSSAAALIQAAHYGGYDVVVIEAPAGGDDHLLSWIRCRASESTPVILVSPDHPRELVVRALEAGADDVLIKPCIAAELVARVNAVHRRSTRERGAASRIEVAGFVLDHDASLVVDRGVSVDLTPREFAIAWFLFTNPSAFACRDAITMAVWGQGRDIAGRTLEQHIHRLRKKLRLCEERGVLIQAAYGRGYRLDVRPTACITAGPMRESAVRTGPSLWPSGRPEAGVSVV
jgi:DNA-binding response OmpR family regulator